MLEISFFRYGRAIEIHWHKRSENTKKWAKTYTTKQSGTPKAKYQNIDNYHVEQLKKEFNLENQRRISGCISRLKNTNK